MLVGRVHHHIEPSMLRSVSIENSGHDVGKPGSVRLPKKKAGLPECESFAVETHVRPSGSIGPSMAVVLFLNTARGKERPHEDNNQDASVGSINVRNNIGPRSQSEMVLVTTPTPTRTIALSSTTTCTTVRSSSASAPSSERIPISRITSRPQTAINSATTAASINSNAAIQTPVGRLYLPHIWDINQGSHMEIGEISQTISISGDEQDDFSLEDQNTNSEWDRPLGYVAEGDLVAPGNCIWSQEDGPTLVGYLGDLVNDTPLNDFDLFPLVTNGNPSMMNGIGLNHGGASATEASDRDLMDDGSSHFEVHNPGEIYDHQRTWEWLSFPLRPEGQAQRLSDIAMQVALIDDILYVSDDEHIGDGDEEMI